MAYLFHFFSALFDEEVSKNVQSNISNYGLKLSVGKSAIFCSYIPTCDIFCNKWCYYEFALTIQNSDDLI